MSRVNKLLEDRPRKSTGALQGRGKENIIQCGPLSDVIAETQMIATCHFLVSDFLRKGRSEKVWGRERLLADRKSSKYTASSLS